MEAVLTLSDPEPASIGRLTPFATVPASAYIHRCAFHATDNTSGTEIVNVIHVSQENLTSGANLQAAVDEIFTWLGTKWQAILTTEMTFDNITLTVQAGIDEIGQQAVHTVNLPGTRASTDRNLSEALCAVVSWRSDTAKRYARGRTFFAPALNNSAAVSPGKWSPSGPYMVACGQFVTTAVAPHTSSDAVYSLVVFSRTRHTENLTPFAFYVKAGKLSPDQHFLRSRTSAP